MGKGKAWEDCAVSSSHWRSGSSWKEFLQEWTLGKRPGLASTAEQGDASHRRALASTGPCLGTTPTPKPGVCTQGRQAWRRRGAQGPAAPRSPETELRCLHRWGRDHDIRYQQMKSTAYRRREENMSGDWMRRRAGCYMQQRGGSGR